MYALVQDLAIVAAFTLAGTSLFAASVASLFDVVDPRQVVRLAARRLLRMLQRRRPRSRTLSRRPPALAAGQ